MIGNILYNVFDTKKESFVQIRKKIKIDSQKPQKMRSFFVENEKKYLQSVSAAIIMKPHLT